MELLYNFRNIIWGYTEEDSTKAIVKSQDGTNYISYPDASFNSNEIVTSFKNYKGYLYALISNTTSGNGRLLKLTKINEGENDTWEEVLTTSDIDSAPSVLEYFDDYLYIISSSEIWYWDESSITSVTSSIPANLDSIYYSIYFKDKIYIHGVNSSDEVYIYEYNGDTTFIELTSADIITFPSGFQPIGKKLMVEYDGKLYFHSIPYLAHWDIEEGILNYDTDDFNHYVTCIYEDRGIIFFCYENSTTELTNILTIVPYQYIKENSLVAGEGKVLESLKTIDSDPIFLISDTKLGKVAYYKEKPVVAVLGGDKNIAIKYGSRLEFYTDLVNVDSIIEKNLKEVMDDLCSMTNNYFKIDGYNTAKISHRDLVGYTDKWRIFKDNGEYGQEYIKNVLGVGVYTQSFKRIIINWSNLIWNDDSPVALGAIEIRDYPTLEYSSDFINDPILAKNIALHMLENSDVSEELSIELAYSYFLEGDEILSFSVLNDDIVYIDKDKEWKLVKVDHDCEEMKSTLLLIERTLLEKREIA